MKSVTVVCCGVAVLSLSAFLVVACSSSPDPSLATDAGADTGVASDANTGAPDAGSDGPASQDSSAPDTGTATPKPLPATITGFTLVAASSAGAVRCDTDGTCYKNTTTRSNLTGTLNTGDGIYKLPPNGTAFALIGDATSPAAAPMFGLITGLALDGLGNVYACGSAQGGTAGSVPYQMSASTGKWAPFGTGIANVRNVICGEALVHDGKALFVSDYTLDKLPTGETIWKDQGASLSSSAISVVVPFKDDVYVGTGGGAADFVYVRKSGAQAFVTVADGVRTLQHLAVDSAGNLLGHTYGPMGGPTASPIFRLAAGDPKWITTTGLAPGSNASNVVFDASDAAYAVGAATATPTVISLMKLTAGSLAWTKVFDLTGQGATETCDGRYGGAVLPTLADDHQGHLVLQCSASFLRSQP